MSVSFPIELDRADESRRIGWLVKRQSGSHRTLSRPNRPDFVFAFHDDEAESRRG